MSRSVRDWVPVVFWVVMAIVIFTMFGFLVAAIITDSGQNNPYRESCLARGGTILEDPYGRMTGCILNP